jgi:hypothetical protein
VAAIKEMLDRGFGKATQPVEGSLTYGKKGRHGIRDPFCSGSTGTACGSARPSRCGATSGGAVLPGGGGAHASSANEGRIAAIKRGTRLGPNPSSTTISSRKPSTGSKPVKASGQSPRATWFTMQPLADPRARLPAPPRRASLGQHGFLRSPSLLGRSWPRAHVAVVLAAAVLHCLAMQGVPFWVCPASSGFATNFLPFSDSMTRTRNYAARRTFNASATFPGPVGLPSVTPEFRVTPGSF